MNQLSYPLEWPVGRKRYVGGLRYWNDAPSRDSGRVALFRELESIGGSNCVLSCNLRPVKDGGRWRANQGKISDNAVAVYFDYKGNRTVLCCDVYATIGANLRAICLTIEQLRRISKRGVSDFLDSAISGFKALPSPSGKGWRSVLGIHVDMPSQKDVRDAYFVLVKVYHPEGTNPDADKFAEIVRAKNQGMNWVKDMEMKSMG